MKFDRDIVHARALVIDANPTSRSLASAQLRDLGIAHVTQAGRLVDGRRHLETQRFDVVVCEQEFPDDTSGGQDLLDDLRRANLLPYTTVFIMATGQARYDRVAEAAESALDGYLLKPYAAGALAERLTQARDRRRVLAAIFAAIEAGELQRATVLCVARVQERGEYWLYAGRIGAELLLRLGRFDAARQLYESIVKVHPVPWAKLGVARAQADAGQLAPARQTLARLVVDEPGFADGHDVLARVLVELGQLEEALHPLRRAAEITPGSVPRLQRQGIVAFLLGETVEAAAVLDRAVALGIGSKMLDPQALVLLAFARLRAQDSKGVQRCRENVAHLSSRAPQDKRLGAMAALVAAVEVAARGDRTAAIGAVTALGACGDDPDLDVEGACNRLVLFAELASRGVSVDTMSDWVETLAMRFSTSRSIGELLARSAACHPPFETQVRQSHARVLALSEQAIEHALAGNPTVAVTTLLEHAQRTLNGKLVETAALTLQRYRARIADAGQLGERIEALRRSYAASWLAPRLGQGARPAGGLLLRGGAAAGGSAAAAVQRDASDAAAGIRTGSPDRAAEPVA